MYGNEVLTDLENFRKDFSEHIKRHTLNFEKTKDKELGSLIQEGIHDINWAKSLIDTIKQSYHFHIADIWDIKSLFDKISSDPFQGENCKWINMPYPKIWLDIQKNDNGKVGIIIEEIDYNSDKYLKVSIITKNKNDKVIKHWMFRECIMYVKLSGDFTKSKQENLFFKSQSFNANFDSFIQVLPNIVFQTLKDFKENEENVSNIYTAFLNELIVVNCFLMTINCKNIEAQDNYHTKLVFKRGKNKHIVNKDKFVYKTLVVETKKPKGGKGTGTGTVSKTKLHFCRGNYATYTEDKPLFGTYVGRVWRQAHIKGNKQEGFIQKDYII